MFHFQSLLSKSPVKELPLHVTFSKPHREGCSICRAFFYLSLEESGERAPSMFPNRAPMKRAAHHQGLLLHIFQSPVKVPLSRFPSQSHHTKDTLFPEPSFTSLAKTPDEEPPPGSPTGPLWTERCPFPEPSFAYLS
jgi:hypothetical protein